jgi:hypothetical protein
LFKTSNHPCGPSLLFAMASGNKVGTAAMLILLVGCTSALDTPRARKNVDAIVSSGPDSVAAAEVKPDYNELKEQFLSDSPDQRLFAQEGEMDTECVKTFIVKMIMKKVPEDYVWVKDILDHVIGAVLKFISGME